MSGVELDFPKKCYNFFVDAQIFSSHIVNDVVKFFTGQEGWVDIEALKNKKWVVNPEGSEGVSGVAAEHFGHGDEECPICLEGMEGVRVEKLDCNHAMCRVCLIAHMESVQDFNRRFFENMGTTREMNCPLCRHPIDNERVRVITGHSRPSPTPAINWDVVLPLIELSLRILILVVEEENRRRRIR